MHLTIQAQAVLLLTVSLGKADNAAKPLSASEWARFALWLKNSGLDPSALLTNDPDSLLCDLADQTISVQRVRALLARGTSLGLSMERWERAGLWVLTRSDHEYPERIKRRLRTASPPVLFGCGNKALLNSGGLAVVGSRKAWAEDLMLSARLGSDAASAGVPIVSGGARGVDEAAMLSALDRGGTAVGVLADSLFKAATSLRFRDALTRGSLALVTPYSPDAAFNVGNAMGRNRYIYCMADAAVVVSCTAGKGGTWNGAIEDLKNGWVPLWVARSQAAGSGNGAIVDEGGRWLPDDDNPIRFLFESAGKLGGIEPEAVSEKTAKTAHDLKLPMQNPEGPDVPLSVAGIENLDFYGLFLKAFSKLTDASPMSVEEIAEALNLEKLQVKAWLSRGIEGRQIEKGGRPIRYRTALWDKQGRML